VLLFYTMPKKNIYAEIMERWLALRQPHDTAAIAEKTGLTKQAIYHAWKTMKPSKKVFDAMHEYYEVRVENLKNVLNATKIKS